jgi:hypothetical protein
MRHLRSLLIALLVVTLSLLAQPSASKRSTQPKTKIVYVTSTRYHREGCRYLLTRASRPMPLKEAKKSGFRPCAVCRPSK